MLSKTYCTSAKLAAITGGPVEFPTCWLFSHNLWLSVYWQSAYHVSERQVKAENISKMSPLEVYKIL